MSLVGSLKSSNKMPRKRRGAASKASAFRGNKHTKVELIDGKRVKVPRDTSTVRETQQNDTRDRAEPTVAVVASKCSGHEHATPTRSKIKIEELT